jgi:hypothetical protein
MVGFSRSLFERYSFMAMTFEFEDSLRREAANGFKGAFEALTEISPRLCRGSFNYSVHSPS